MFPEIWLLGFALMVLFLFIGSAAGLNASRRIRRLQDQIETLTRQVQWLRSKLEDPDTAVATEPTPAAAPDQRTALAQLRDDLAQRDDTDASSRSENTDAQDSLIDASAPTREDARPRTDWGALLATHWMTLLGGLCVAIAGLFMVRYSMDQGWLGPLARILAALASGAALLMGSEWLRRRQGRSVPALAAMAGAGSITLYGALMAALRLYDLISPGTAFVLMAMVALATMLLALMHGPLLAGFGVVGAYLVPILVSTGSGDVRIAMVYALIISASALVLLRYVYRPWLWWGCIAGALGWWLLSLGSTDADGVRSAYLAVLAYLMAALPTLDFWLREQRTLDYAGYQPRAFFRALNAAQRQLIIAYALIGVACYFSIAHHTPVDFPWTQGLPLLFVSVWLARQRDAVFFMPWLVTLAMLAGWLQTDTVSSTLLRYLTVSAVLCAGSGLWLYLTASRKATSASLTTVAPVLFMALAYQLGAQTEHYLLWGLATAVYAFANLTLAAFTLRREAIESLAIWWIVAGHLAIALAAAIVFEQATLTLVIAAQTLSLAAIIRRFKLTELGWLLKLVVAIVIARLSLNPWLADYPVSAHWSLWTFGGATLCTAIAAHWLREHATLARWAEGAALHLFVLTVWSELRYQLYDGELHRVGFIYTEAVLVMCLAATLAVVYYRRGLISEHLQKLYGLYAWGLTAIATAFYGAIIVRTLASDPWAYQSVQTTPILNVLLLAFGFPVLAAIVFRAYFDPRVYRWAGYAAGAGALLFVSLEIRHLWTGSVRLNFPSTNSGELYTYSLVWLAIALGGLSLGRAQPRGGIYRAGMGLLAIVILKVFLVDLSDLGGLLRVASFMGLGLSLLGMAYWHQRLGQSSQGEPT
ncbi:MAG: DUF2339 domain-containing protein [Pseudomonadota bacterium]